MIDLHTHTNASDGRCTPDELVGRALAAGVRVLAVTDHDTVAACETVAAGCAAAGIEFVSGIEMTAVREETDVHTLGYFLDTTSPALARFLDEQRLLRLERVRRIVDRLAALGMVLDGDAIMRPAREDPSRSAGRPWVARALVAAGYVSSTDEAFTQWLARGRPAFVPRIGVSPEQVIALVHDVGGLASVAHPGLLGRDGWLPSMIGAGLDAIEAYHTDHDEAATARYVAMATRYGVGVSGGSDFHGDAFHGGRAIGAVSLPQEAFDRLKRLAARPA